jgi:hypothetical protein
LVATVEPLHEIGDEIERQPSRLDGGEGAFVRACRRARHLGDPDTTLVDGDQVREGAADLHTDAHRYAIILSLDTVPRCWSHCPRRGLCYSKTRASWGRGAIGACR